MKLFFDTNILIDYLNGIEPAQSEIERSGERHISIITWMEMLAGAHDDAEEDVIDMFFAISASSISRAARLVRQSRSGAAALSP